MTHSLRTGTLVLASKSPRRRALLDQAGLAFAVVPSSVDESRVAASLPEKRARLLAEAKAHEVAQRYPQSWVIGADTMVVIANNVLEKPRTEHEARHMLHALSGKTHRVLTGYCICCKAAKECFSDTVETKVRFKTLTKEEIDWYIDTAEPFDKAGGYGAQGLGTFLIRRLEGSYTSVVGLPVCEVIDYLVKKGAVQR
ncbi:MAG: Maf family protein [Thermodesulfobacteriota bacterium]|nr:Maf family protein [Thermodesulfobacteriota bacterium]